MLMTFYLYLFFTFKAVHSMLFSHFYPLLNTVDYIAIIRKLSRLFPYLLAFRWNYPVYGAAFWTAG